ncbi:MAG: bifunctional (p)ppGpp synthetase/guanosine-3',5'-bis(diphosphate) 3'-pyrophosphohydrolase [Lachnospiraceae bacterium]|nr:bifunctional (p)ppGpp synthetase/guanosine-3',5'-bis(diphosphate) 3'-pyrophosphohydrolase [Lachnospiraceae bacterium]
MPQDLTVRGKTPLVLDDGHIETMAEYREPEELYRDLIERVKKYHPSDDVSLIEKAYRVAYDAHEGQVRKSGEPYIIHPLCVGIILAELEMDQETIAAGLLHDVVEDTIFSVEELKEEFGEDVALLVDGVTKLGQLQYDGDKMEVQAENLRKMFLAMAKDIRVIIIKLCDRLHNMRTLKHMPPEKQQEKARETMDIYAPIAQRLGIMRVKVELDDLSLKYLEPDVYYDLADKIATRKSEREKYVAMIVDEVSEHIVNAGIKARIDGRVKHFYSIYKKMKNQNKTIDQIYDLFAVRIIVDSVKDCYAALGVIHEMYKPIPGRFKDYIAMPKANMYQSLHTTLIGSTGQPFEIQIRTAEMHKTAEYGIAAHWKYKRIANGEKLGKDSSEEEKLSWLKQILEWQQDTSDNKQYLQVLKSDLELFSDSVYCFTPTGDVKNLPAGSTPIDFAYAIHSAVGNRMIGARVNGKLVTIDYKIKNGDRIEIVTSQNSKGPSLDWLSVVKSTQARNKINQWFKNERKDENIIRGRELLLDYCKAKGYSQVDIMRPEYMESVMHKYGFKDWESVLAALGHGGLKEGQIINKMVDMYEKDHPKEVTEEDILKAVEENNQQAARRLHRHGADISQGIVVKGITDVSVRFSKCCSPVPGDEIIGFVTRGRGVSIHRTDCMNILSLPEIERSRLIDAEWQEESLEGGATYLVDIEIIAMDRSGLLADISRALTEKDIDIRSLNTRINKQRVATIEVGFEVHSKTELAGVMDRLRGIEGITDIERKTG